MPDPIRVAIFRPGVAPTFEHIVNDLECLQALVGGYIEALSISQDGLLLICNEDGKRDLLPLNRLLAGPRSLDVLVGTFFVCRSLPPAFASIWPADEDRLAAWKLAGIWDTASGGVLVKKYG